jgi:hypothetical protein
MSSLNEITYSIWEKLRNELSDDDSIDERLIRSEIHSQRALFLRNEYNRNRSIDPFVIQDLGCVELEVVDRAECCDITIDCSIVRTSLKVPSLVELHSETVMWVNPIDKVEKSFSLISYERAKWISGHRFTSRQIYAFVLNNYIYLISEDDTHSQITHLSIRGIFENPEEVASFNTCEGESCFDADGQYPLKAWMRTYIETQVYNNLLSKLKNPSDTTNDASSKKLTP